MMKFEEVLFRAQQGEAQSIEQIIEMFRPMLIRNALVKGVFDKELYQELIIEVLKCIHYFENQNNRQNKKGMVLNTVLFAGQKYYNNRS